MGSTLNDTNFQNWLLPTKTPQPVKWYRGAYFVYGNDYTNNLSTSNTSNEFQITSGNKSIGLIKIGEIMSGQSLSMITSNYKTMNDVVNRYSRTNRYWTLTSCKSSMRGLWTIMAMRSYDDVTNAGTGFVQL
jgi:hypothetical protein